MFAYTIMYLTFGAPQIVARIQVHANVYLAAHLQIERIDFRVDLISIPLTINPETSLGIQTASYREWNPLSIQNQTTRQLSVNCVWKQGIWSVFLGVSGFKTARLLADIFIRPSRLCGNGGFAQITYKPSNTHIMVEIFTIFQN